MVSAVSYFVIIINTIIIINPNSPALFLRP